MRGWGPAGWGHKVVGLGLWIGLLGAGPAWAQEVCSPTQDCDGDGYSAAQGDCDDEDPDVHPSALEDCTNLIDDDCDNLINEGCDRSAQQGRIQGGGSCSETGGLALLALPLLGRRRRSAVAPR